MREFWRGTTGLALLMMAAPLAAQQNVAASGDAIGDSDEIIVTAQKREQRLQDVPLSIIVKTGDSLRNAGINDFNALPARVPNLVIVDTPANKSIVIRGIGTSGNSFSFEQSVALFVDGIYGGRNRQFNQPFLDVERVEVLRGPQGALFGRNTSAGAISILSTRPKDELGGDVFGEYEFVRDSYNITGIVNAPVTDNLAVRVAGRYNRGFGFLDNVVLDRKEPSREDILVRGSLLFKPVETVNIFGKVEYTRSDITGSAFEFVPNGGRPDYLKDTDDAFAPERDNSETFNAVLQADIEIGDHTLTSITGYSRYNYDQAFNIQARRPARLVVVNDEVFTQWSQELRIASPSGGRFDYVFGAYVEGGKSDVNRQSLIDTPPTTGLNTRTFRSFAQKTDVIALFAQGNYKLTDTLTIGAGVRWTQIKKRGSVIGGTELFTGAPTTTIIPRALLADRFTENDVAPTATLTWAPNSNANFYFRYARGNKGGAFSEFQNVTARDFILRPEKSDAFELGARLQVPQVNGFLNVTLFTTDYADLQKSALDLQTASFVTSNAAGARTRGVEIEAGVEPMKGLRLNAALAYLDARYTSWPNGPCRFDNPNRLVPGCTQDRAGDRLQSSPEFTGNVSIDYNAPVSDSLRVFGNATLTFTSDINYQEALNRLEEQDGFSKTDIRVGVGGVRTGWEVALLVRNVFDERTSGLIFEVFPVGVGPNDRAHAPDPGRTVALQARFKF